MIVPYTVNKEVRPIIRILISDFFIHILNLIAGMNLRYYTGMVLHRTKLLRKVNITTYSFAFQAEILIKLIKSGYTYIEVPNYIKKTKGSSLFKLKNLLGSIKTIISLFIAIHIKKQEFVK